MPVKHGERGCARRDALGRNLSELIAVLRSLARVAQVRLVLHQHILVVHRIHILRVDHHRPVHARGHVQAHGRSRAVVQPDAGAGRLKTVHQFLTRGDGFHRIIGGDHARVEIKRMPHRPVIFKGNLKNVTQFAVQNRAHIRAVERPRLHVHPGGDFAVKLLHVHGYFVHGLPVTLLTRRYGLQHRVTPLIALSGGCVQINVPVLGRHHVRPRTVRPRATAGGAAPVVPIRLQVRTGGLHMEQHALLPVPGNRAPALGVGSNHANIHAFRLTRVNRAGLSAVIERQIVGHALILVRHLNHQAVTHRHLRSVRGETVV